MPPDVVGRFGALSLHNHWMLTAQVCLALRAKSDTGMVAWTIPRRWLEGAEIAGSERETELADVGRERPLANLLRNPAESRPPTAHWAPPRRHRWTSWRAYESPVVPQLIRFQV